MYLFLPITHTSLMTNEHNDYFVPPFSLLFDSLEDAVSPHTPPHLFPYTSSASFCPQPLPVFAPFHLTSQWDQTGLSRHGMTGEWEGVGMTNWTGPRPNTLSDRQTCSSRETGSRTVSPV